jgi:UTP--glucose-1-phosphate uridylyltransferase
MILDEVDPATRAVLERYDFDEGRFARLREQVAAGDLSPASNFVRGPVEPPAEGDIARVPQPGEPGYEEALEAGLDALRRGEAAVAVLNGGMATRFGGTVKGILEAVDGKSFLEWKLADAARAGEAAGADIPFVVMNSFATDAATRAFLAERAGDFPDPLVFTQSVSLRLEPGGALFRHDDGRASPHGPGHGDFSESLRSSGLLGLLRDRGVRLLTLSNVDNLGARVDPAVLGAHVLSGARMSVEVVEKDPGDAGGAPARVDGRLVVVEGFRFPPEFDQGRIDVFAINNFVFDLDALDRDFELDWLYVEKTVDGRPAVQLERLVNELAYTLPAAFLRVRRRGPRGRFVPVKTPADLEAAREPLRQLLAARLLD